MAQKIATKRSGQRGHTARQALLAAEAELLSIQSQDPQLYVTPKMTNDLMKEVFEAYEGLDVGGDESRAKAILRGLGFSDKELNNGGAEISRLSGGWRMRVMLGKALFVKPDILLLDEPSESKIILTMMWMNSEPPLTSANHLDLPAILWLEDHLLNECEGQTIVVVSHDRNFLDAVTDETIIFRNMKLGYHAGNYQDWESTTEEQRKRKARLKEVGRFQKMLPERELIIDQLDAKRRKHILSSIQKSVQQAKSSGDDKRLGLVASRKKVDCSIPYEST